MSIFEPVHAFFRRRAVKTLNDAAACVYLVNRRQESPRGNFVFPGTDYLDDIEVDGHRVGHVDYGINPLGDRLYINMLEIAPAQQGQGIGLGVLWRLWCAHQVPIVPLYQYTSSDGFWYQARRRFAAAGAVIEDELRGVQSMELEQARWQHLVPEAEDKRLIREYWEWVAAEHAAGRPAGPGIP
ncbi:N-acetyltransferase [Pseudomonas sp. PA-3-11C]|uniref:N-acetyltransferase n=1 Tax=unclassified Pseudomonas TaxID=196821 RepID=UPI001F18C54A|nr:MULTISPECIES: N-acetyltransferase [unclassified Pseudomonas]MCF5508506.1 N-acetyltransferase [Pseudomonas sp. PA-3-6H]MCF5516201.1 N-acetyltransferase [Pseudomonas sp. PA-3-6E]MCF5563916.1 N-acetyltransferase [Pseudomonas sp. PA-3-5D]MCF5566820.1 N-acetyltransferase [Pseudomonas sp. PA-3-11C]MCF5593733.1 N-acetyltransferase [Pseudomonas sp. PA-3-10C]